MKNKTLPLIILFVILFVGGYLLLSQPQDVTAPPIKTKTDVQNIAPSATEEPLATSTPKQKYEVTYTADGFNPAVTSLNVGDTVIFTNKSGKDFWPASNEHPTHTTYPELDAKTEITDGQTYEFVFVKSGAWGYHNHLSPKMMGVVVVK